MSKVQKATTWLFHWGAYLALATLSVAGGIHLLAGLDAFIVYPVSIVLVALLVRETL